MALGKYEKGNCQGSCGRKDVYIYNKSKQLCKTCSFQKVNQTHGPSRIPKTKPTISSVKCGLTKLISGSYSETLMDQESGLNSGQNTSKTGQKNSKDIAIQDFLKRSKLRRKPENGKNCPGKKSLKDGKKQWNKNAKDNDKVYREFWEAEKKPVRCIECQQELFEFNPFFCSHILTKNANPKMRYDIRAIVPMCVIHHIQWEYGKRKNMKCFAKLEEKRQQLTLESYKK